MTASRAERNEPIKIGDQVVAPGERLRFDLPAAYLPTHTPIHIPLTVANGLKAGPVLWVSAAIHGDELNGVEIIRRVMSELEDPLPRGAVIAAPIVNVFGFLEQSRYLPDRRDMNRSFPGSKRGSLAGRMAHLFLEEIVSACTHGIDLHTASTDKTNYPQIRADLTDPETLRCAQAFGAPVMLNSSTRDGSLRFAATKRGVTVLLFEGGAPLRFDEPVIDIGVRGVFGVMRELKMIRRRSGHRRPRSSIRLEESSWVRARRGGILRLFVDSGSRLEAKQVIGEISDPFGDEPVAVKAPFAGIVIGRTKNPIVHGGDALVHVGKLD